MDNTCFLISRRRASAVPAFFLRAFGSPISRLGLFSSLDPPRRVAPFRDAASRPNLPFLLVLYLSFSLSFSFLSSLSFFLFLFLSTSLRLSIFPLLSSSRFFSLYLCFSHSLPSVSPRDPAISLYTTVRRALAFKHLAAFSRSRPRMKGMSSDALGPLYAFFFFLFTAPPSSADTQISG